MNFKKSKSIATGLVAALFVTAFAIGCDNSGDEKKVVTDSPKVVVVDSPKVIVVDSPKKVVIDSPKMDKAAPKPVVKP